MSSLLAGVPRRAPDPILAVMEAFRADPRPDKIDLGVGVYRTADGRTPVFAAVAEAERRIAAAEITKSYTSLAGDPAFHRALGALVLGDAVPVERVAALATPGGTGALHQAFVLLRGARPDATVWMPDATWPNHPELLRHARVPARDFRYLATNGLSLDAAGMLEDVARASPGDAVLLHGCCHNPSGVDLTAADWDALIALCAERRLLPIVDLAYQGLGDTPEHDAAGLRRMAAALPDMLVAVSCSKTFGLYRERAGLLLAISAPDLRDPLQQALAWQNRLTYAFPPDHGARVVSTILDAPDLRQSWSDELAGMRARIAGNRASLATALRDGLGSTPLDRLADGRGMFSRLPLSPDQIAALRDHHGIYLIGDGRANLAGLSETDTGQVAEALVAVGLRG